MKMWLRIIIGIVACIGFHGTSYAFGGWSGNDLRSKCEVLMKGSDPQQWDAKSAVSTSYCIGFVEGVIEGTMITAILGNQGEYPYCMPTTTSPRQDAAVVAKYLNDNPDQWHLPAGLLITRAFSLAYPCSHK